MAETRDRERRRARPHRPPCDPTRPETRDGYRQLLAKRGTADRHSYRYSTRQLIALVTFREATGTRESRPGHDGQAGILSVSGASLDCDRRYTQAGAHDALRTIQHNTSTLSGSPVRSVSAVRLLHAPPWSLPLTRCACASCTPLPLPPRHIACYKARSRRAFARARLLTGACPPRG